MQKSHTYKNIIRDREFCVNFIDYRYIENCWDTVKNNLDEIDEFKAGDFTEERSKIIAPPRIAESFMSLECSLESSQDISKAGVNVLIIG
jgi:flavin reductase (DIM6/NTAB) family NADH-FMN oxidoreductase RutF